MDVLSYGTCSLVEVAFGCKMNADFEPIIRNWVREGNHERVQFVKARLCDSPYGYEYLLGSEQANCLMLLMNAGRRGQFSALEGYFQG